MVSGISKNIEALQNTLNATSQNRNDDDAR